MSTATITTALRARVIDQFARPHGPLGLVAGRIMANRATNVERNRWIIDLLEPDPTGRILEIGHGPGIALEALWPRLTTGSVTGVELSATMHRSARRRLRGAIATGRVALRIGDAQALPADLTDLSLIYGVNTSMFWHDRAATIADLARRLVPRGELALVYMPPPTADDDPADVAAELAADFRAAGLTGVRQDEMPFEPPAIATRGVRSP